MKFQPWQYVAARISARFLEESNEDVRDDESLVGISVQNAGRNLQYASERLRAHKATVLLAISSDPLAIQYASVELQDDYDVILAAVDCPPRSLDWMFCVEGAHYHPKLLGGLSCASERLRDNYDIVMTSVKQNGYSLKFASERLRDNDEIVEEALKSTKYRAIKVASERFRTDRELVHDAVTAGAIEYVSPSFLTKELVEVAVKNSPYIYSVLPNKWRDEDSILHLAIRSDGKYLEFANDRQKSDLDTVKMAIQSNPIAFQFALPKIKQKDELIQLAVTGGLLLPEKYFSNEKLVLINLMNVKRYQESGNQPAVLFYDDWYKGDWLKKSIKSHTSSRDVAIAAIQCRGEKPKAQYFELFDDEVKRDFEFCRAAIAAQPYIYQILPDEMKGNRDLALQFIEASSSPELKKLPDALSVDREIVRRCLLKWVYNVDDLPLEFADLPEAFRAKVLRSFDGSDLTDKDIEKLCANPDLLEETAQERSRILLLRRGLQGDRQVLLKAARRAQSDYGSSILDELAADYEILEQLEFIPENIPPQILADREFIKKRVLGPWGFRGLSNEIQSDDELVMLFLEAGKGDPESRFNGLPAHVKKRQKILLFAISVGAIRSTHHIPEKFQNDDVVLNAFYGWLEKNLPS